MAVLFAREGSDVTIVYLPEEQEDAEETKAMVEKEGRKCLLVAGDLMDNAKCKEAVQKHVDEYGIIHVLVNNASKQIMCEDFAEIDLDNVESTFRSNILQMFAMTKFSLPHMKKGASYVFGLKVKVRGRGADMRQDHQHHVYRCLPWHVVPCRLRGDQGSHHLVHTSFGKESAPQGHPCQCCRAGPGSYPAAAGVANGRGYGEIWREVAAGSARAAERDRAELHLPRVQRFRVVLWTGAARLSSRRLGRS